MTQVDQNNNDSTSILLPQLLNPFRYAKVLIQLGYEPLKPYYGHNLLSIFNLSEKKLRYPWIGGYLYHMYKMRGSLNLLFVGAGARFTGDILNLALEKTAHNYICGSVKNDEKEMEDVVEECTLSEFQIIILQLSVTRLTEIMITYPFKVIMTRQMADFIVDDSSHQWFHNALLCIYQENGIMGFYKGFIPHAISEVSKCMLYYLSCRIIKNILKSRPTRRVTQNNDEVVPRKDKTLQLILRSFLRYLCSNLFYPFEVVSTVMMLDNVPLKGGHKLSQFYSWRLCWRALKSENQLYRGYSFMLRDHVQSIQPSQF